MSGGPRHAPRRRGASMICSLVQERPSPQAVEIWERHVGGEVDPAALRARLAEGTLPGCFQRAGARPATAWRSRSRTRRFTYRELGERVAPLALWLGGRSAGPRRWWPSSCPRWERQSTRRCSGRTPGRCSAPYKVSKAVSVIDALPLGRPGQGSASRAGEPRPTPSQVPLIRFSKLRPEAGA